MNTFTGYSTLMLRELFERFSGSTDVEYVNEILVEIHRRALNEKG